MPTYYDVLQVERDASPDRIRRAYRKLAQKYHPDKMPGNANAARAMAAINAAYEVLSDADQRAAHDRWIRHAERPGPALPRPAGPPPTLWAFVHPAENWPWYVLAATLALAVGTIATAVYLTAMPARATAAPAPPSAAAPSTTAPATTTALRATAAAESPAP